MTWRVHKKKTPSPGAACQAGVNLQWGGSGEACGSVQDLEVVSSDKPPIMVEGVLCHMHRKAIFGGTAGENTAAKKALAMRQVLAFDEPVMAPPQEKKKRAPRRKADARPT